jgi:predicted HNH restriction endonuclease
MTYSTHKCGTIRKKAREILEESKVEKVCAYCKNHDFDDILEVHHIKSIMSFDRDAKMKEINSLSNLIWLCPNHHKMLEKGLIKIDKEIINENK